MRNKIRSIQSETVSLNCFVSRRIIVASYIQFEGEDPSYPHINYMHLYGNLEKNNKIILHRTSVRCFHLTFVNSKVT